MCIPPGDLPFGAICDFAETDSRCEVGLICARFADYQGNPLGSQMFCTKECDPGEFCPRSDFSCETMAYPDFEVHLCMRRCSEPGSAECDYLPPFGEWSCHDLADDPLSQEHLFCLP